MLESATFLKNNTMESSPDIFDFSPESRKKQSPTKHLMEPDAEISPQKVPIKVSRVNLNLFAKSSPEKKKTFADHYDRVQSHSTSRQVAEEESSMFRKLFDDKNSAMRSLSRDFSLRQNYKNSEVKDKEIEQLNFKIRNLIKEKNDLRSKIESQNKLIVKMQIKKSNQVRYDNIINNKLENSLLEVTFKPKDDGNEAIQKHKRFPREVFRLPKSKGLYSII